MCAHIINKQKHQIDKKVRRQDNYISTRSNYANKKIREIWMNVVKTTYNSTEDMIIKLQELKGKTNLKFYKNVSKYYDEMKNRSFQFQEDSFAKNAQGISKIYHKFLLLLKFSPTKPQLKKMNINYYDLFYTVIKISNDIEAVYENGYINFNDFLTPNTYVGIKPRETILK